VIVGGARVVGAVAVVVGGIATINNFGSAAVVIGVAAVVLTRS